MSDFFHIALLTNLKLWYNSSPNGNYVNDIVDLFNAIIAKFPN
jgi:hypothetical protein